MSRQSDSPWKILKPGTIIASGDEIKGVFGWVRLADHYAGTAIPSSETFGTIRRLIPARIPSLERSRNYWKRRALKAEAEREQRKEDVRRTLRKGHSLKIESITLRAGEEFKPSVEAFEKFEKRGKTYWRMKL